jgi:hypothetical protein
MIMGMGEFSLTNRKWVVVMVFWTLLHVVLLFGGYNLRDWGTSEFSEYGGYYAINEWFPTSEIGLKAYDPTEFLAYVGFPWAVLWAVWYLRKGKGESAFPME